MGLVPTVSARLQGSSQGLTGKKLPPLPSFVDIPKANSEGWKASRIAPEAFARATDAAIRNLAGLTAETRTILDTHLGRGTSSGTVTVQNPSRFRFEYPYVTKTPRDFEKQMLVADGERFAMLTTGGWKNHSPVGARARLLDPSLLAQWPYRFGRYLAAGVGTTEAPLSRLVAEARRPASDIVLRTEETSLRSGGRVFKMQRLLLSRRPKSKKPALQIEVVVDADSKLPLTVRSAGKFGSPKPMRAFWTARWDKAQTFSPKLFSVPKSLADSQ
jgi:hypothetical protein